MEIFEDTALWEAMDPAQIPTKNEFGPRAIIFGGWFPTCAAGNSVCILDRSSDNRGAMCVYDCTIAGAIGGRFSAQDIEDYIKVPPYKRTDKTYSPNITE